uniref:Uncharacterized protein n=1 Tax=Fagus sylvatica TaxID=28930 RepID=A0A2N9F1K8_FAGSY
MSLKKMDNELTESIETFVKGHVEVPPPEEKSTILRCAWLSSLSWKLTQRCKQQQEQKNSVHPDPIHLLDLLRTRLLDNHQQPNQTKQKGQNWQSYHNVQELRAAVAKESTNTSQCLGSDAEVAQLFNEIGTDLVPNIEIYSDVKSEIQNHYNNTLRTWIAQFIHDRFSSPWACMAFTVAIIGLALTAA